jgi:hypothetical protein
VFRVGAVTEVAMLHGLDAVAISDGKSEEDSAAGDEYNSQEVLGSAEEGAGAEDDRTLAIEFASHLVVV